MGIVIAKHHGQMTLHFITGSLINVVSSPNCSRSPKATCMSCLDFCQYIHVQKKAVLLIYKSRQLGLQFLCTFGFQTYSAVESIISYKDIMEIDDSFHLVNNMLAFSCSAITQCKEYPI